MDTTVLIPAWNAEAYIERALRSIDVEVAVILVDDFSTDDTVTRAQSIGLPLLRVIQPPEKRGLGLVRQTALDAVETPYAVWLDADDECLPGRIERMLAPLRAGEADFISDAQELVDGSTGSYIKDLPIPAFIAKDRDKVRLFERNWLPGIAHVAFRTDIGKRIGYDTTLHGGDDSDFVWRAIAAGARFHFIHQKGYCMYAYPGSDSRKIEKQRGMVARALRKHSFESVRELYQNNGFSERITAWGLNAFALFRGEMDAAESFLDQAGSLIEDPQEILEPDGPYPVPEGWRYSFLKGVSRLSDQDSEEAIKQFETGLKFGRRADILNNMGVAHWMAGDGCGAQDYFEEALIRYPNYLDARLNLESPESQRITLHPLRMQPSRDDY